MKRNYSDGSPFSVDDLLAEFGGRLDTLRQVAEIGEVEGRTEHVVVRGRILQALVSTARDVIQDYSIIRDWIEERLDDNLDTEVDLGAMSCEELCRLRTEIATELHQRGERK